MGMETSTSTGQAMRSTVDWKNEAINHNRHIVTINRAAVMQGGIIHDLHRGHCGCGWVSKRLSRSDVHAAAEQHKVRETAKYRERNAR